MTDGPGDTRELAVVELLGALTYGQLRAFEVTARAVRFAPDVRTAERLASFALREHEGWAVLRGALTERTDLGEAVLERQKPRFDAFFDAMPVDDWLGATLFFSVGLPIAADFVRQLAPTLEPDVALVVVGALADRGPFEQFALDAVRRILAEADDEEAARARHLVADVLGRALTGFQEALGDTDALKVLLADAAGREDVPPESHVKRVAITVLEGHRRRMHALGLEDLD
jgi:hypothetical protein